MYNDQWSKDDSFSNSNIIILIINNDTDNGASLVKLTVTISRGTQRHEQSSCHERNTGEVCSGLGQRTQCRIIG